MVMFDYLSNLEIMLILNEKIVTSSTALQPLQDCFVKCIREAHLNRDHYLIPGCHA